MTDRQSRRAPWCPHTCQSVYGVYRDASERYVRCARAGFGVCRYPACAGVIPTPTESHGEPIGCPLSGELHTLEAACEALGVSHRKLTIAAAAGIFPTYTQNGRRDLVRIVEIRAAIDCSNDGGWQ